MYFEMETTYDRPTVQALQDILNRTVRAKRIRLVQICSLIVAALALIYGVIWLLASFQTGVTIVPGISGLVMCVIFLFIGLRYKSRFERQGRHMVHQTPVTIRYSFHENGYTTGKGKEAAHTPYRLLRTLCCGGNYDVLMLDRRRVFVIDHSRFLQGDPEQFRRFLEERTGLTFQRADA